MSILEVLASASILTILITFFATLSIRIHRLAKGIEKDQTTIHEVANVLEVEIAKQAHGGQGQERLTIQPTGSSAPNPKNEATDIAVELPPSPILESLWPRGRLMLHRSHDAMGERLTISFFKSPEQLDALPISITGWVPASLVEPADNGQTLGTTTENEPQTGVKP